MAKSLKTTHSIGIKELKDQASAIVQSVQKTGRPVIITKNNRAIARIEPLRGRGPVERLMELGLISRKGSQNWNELELLGKPGKANLALQSILDDREND